jgi:hypothetical protein
MLLFALALGVADIPESQLVTEVDGKEVFAPAFRGTWSESAAECRNDQSLYTFTIGETRLDGYEWDAVLLKTTPMIGQSGPKPGQWANTVVVLTADRGETDVGIGKRRISLLDGKLYMSNADAVSADDHFNAKYANVRCSG